MSERDGYIPGVPCWVDSSHPDPEAAARFYGDLFGWEIEDVMPEGADSSYLIGRITSSISHPNRSPSTAAPPSGSGDGVDPAGHARDVTVSLGHCSCLL